MLFIMPFFCHGVGCIAFPDFAKIRRQSPIAFSLAKLVVKAKRQSAKFEKNKNKIKITARDF